MGTFDELMKLNKKAATPSQQTPANEGSSPIPKEDKPTDSPTVKHKSDAVHKTLLESETHSTPQIPKAKIERKKSTTTPRYHDTVIPSYHDAIVETIRMAVKAFGKEAATHRFTPEEKKA